MVGRKKKSPKKPKDMITVNIKLDNQGDIVPIRYEVGTTLENSFENLYKMLKIYLNNENIKFSSVKLFIKENEKFDYVVLRYFHEINKKSDIKCVLYDVKAICDKALDKNENEGSETLDQSDCENDTIMEIATSLSTEHGENGKTTPIIIEENSEASAEQLAENAMGRTMVFIKHKHNLNAYSKDIVHRKTGVVIGKSTPVGINSFVVCPVGDSVSKPTEKKQIDVINGAPCTFDTSLDTEYTKNNKEPKRSSSDNSSDEKTSRSEGKIGIKTSVYKKKIIPRFTRLDDVIVPSLPKTLRKEICSPSFLMDRSSTKQLLISLMLTQYYENLSGHEDNNSDHSLFIDAMIKKYKVFTSVYGAAARRKLSRMFSKAKNCRSKIQPRKQLAVMNVKPIEVEYQPTPGCSGCALAYGAIHHYNSQILKKQVDDLMKKNEIQQASQYSNFDQSNTDTSSNSFKYAETPLISASAEEVSGKIYIEGGSPIKELHAPKSSGCIRNVKNTSDMLPVPTAKKNKSKSAKDIKLTSKRVPTLEAEKHITTTSTATSPYKNKLPAKVNQDSIKNHEETALATSILETSDHANSLLSEVQSVKDINSTKNILAPAATLINEEFSYESPSEKNNLQIHKNVSKATSTIAEKHVLDECEAASIREKIVMLNAILNSSKFAQSRDNLKQINVNAKTISTSTGNEKGPDNSSSTSKTEPKAGPSGVNFKNKGKESDGVDKSVLRWLNDLTPKKKKSELLLRGSSAKKTLRLNTPIKINNTGVVGPADSDSDDAEISVINLSPRNLATDNKKIESMKSVAKKSVKGGVEDSSSSSDSSSSINSDIESETMKTLCQKIRKHDKSAQIGTSKFLMDSSEDENVFKETHPGDDSDERDEDDVEDHSNSDNSHKSKDTTDTESNVSCQVVVTESKENKGCIEPNNVLIEKSPELTIWEYFLTLSVAKQKELIGSTSNLTELYEKLPELFDFNMINDIFNSFVPDYNNNLSVGTHENILKKYLLINKLDNQTEFLNTYKECEIYVEFAKRLKAKNGKNFKNVPFDLIQFISDEDATSEDTEISNCPVLYIYFNKDTCKITSVVLYAGKIQVAIPTEMITPHSAISLFYKTYHVMCVHYSEMTEIFGTLLELTLGGMDPKNISCKPNKGFINFALSLHQNIHNHKYSVVTSASLGEKHELKLAVTRRKRKTIDNEDGESVFSKKKSKLKRRKNK